MHSQNNKKISVVVTTYNTESCLAECLESIINNTYKNIEIILVDDGSTDSSLDICYDFAQKDSRVKVITQKNSGVSSARNNGLKNASGFAVHFMDGDDYVSRDFYELLIKAILVNNADIATSSFYNEKTGFLDTTTKDYCFTGLMGRLTANDGWMRGAVSYLYKFDFLKQHNDLVFDTEMFYGEDTLFVVKALFYAKKVAMVSDAIYYYRWNVKFSTQQYRTPEQNSIVYEQQVLVGKKLDLFAEEHKIPKILWERHISNNFKKQLLHCEDIAKTQSQCWSPHHPSSHSFIHLKLPSLKKLFIKLLCVFIFNSKKRKAVRKILLES